MAYNVLVNGGPGQRFRRTRGTLRPVRSTYGWGSTSQCANEFLGGNIGLTQNTCESSNLDFAMHRYHTALRSAPHDDVATGLSEFYETKTLEGFYDCLA